MSHAFAIRRFHTGRFTSIAAASVLSLFALQPAAHAAVVYLDPCFACALNTTPPAGDEWVIQGSFVHVGVDGLASQGALTNNATVFSNNYGFTAFAALTNNKMFSNSGSLGVLGAALTNKGTFLNTGSMVTTTKLDNLSGQLVNSGTFQSFAAITNKAMFANTGTVKLTNGGSLLNEVGGTIDNGGAFTVQFSSITNKGTVRNRAGGVLKSTGIFNTGTFTNDAGGIVDADGFMNTSGSRLINHGTITTADGHFELAAGSNYDFTGGTLVISSSLGRVFLNRDFTFGEARAGTVQANYGGSLTNYAHLQVAKGFTQNVFSSLNNQATGVLDVNLNATMNNSALINWGKVNNLGTVSIGEVLLNRGSFVNRGTLALEQFTQIINSGVIDNFGTLALNNGSLDNGGTINNSGSFTLDGDVTRHSMGVFNNKQGGVLNILAPFALGGERSGVVTLDAGGKVSVQSTLTNIAGHIQDNKGAIVIAPGGHFDNKGTLTHSGLITNGGRFTNTGVVQGTGSLQQDEGYTTLAGSTTFSNVTINRGQLVMQSGGSLNVDRLTVGFMGDVKHNGGAVINAANGVTLNGTYRFEGTGGTIKGLVNNNGVVRVVASKAVFDGRFVHQGQFISEGGSSSQFKDLEVGVDGVIKAGVDDFTVTGNFLNGSLQGAGWRTDDAKLILQGAGLHKLSLAGADLGAKQAGYVNNFAWGELVLGAGGQYALSDGNASAGGALYVERLTLGGGLSQLASVSSAFNIYYDVKTVGNEYLGGKTYALGSGGGKLIGVSDLNVAETLNKSKAMPMGFSPTAVPEPSSWALAMGGVLVTLWRRKARRAAHSS